MKELELDYVKDRLFALGFSSTEEYLASQHFRRLFQKVMIRNRGKCYFCANPASTLYFASCAFDVLKGQQLRSLIPVCSLHRDRITSKKTFAFLMQCRNARKRRQQRNV